MFGEKIDTFILRPLTHDRNKLTEDQIENMADEQSIGLSYALNRADFDKFCTRAGNYFDWKGKKILDVGCGKGNLTNFLAKEGASEVWGIDLQSTHIKIAKSIAVKEDIRNVNFIECDFHIWETQERFDYVISYEALDHVPNTRRTLEKMASLLSRGGRIINFAGGFWLGPSADHCDEFMRFFIPWRHFLFNERALFNIRRERYRPTDPANCFEDIRGGLSKYTLAAYKEAIHDLGLKVICFENNYQFKYKYKGVFYPVSKFLTGMPFMGEFFVFSSFAVLTNK